MTTIVTLRKGHDIRYFTSRGDGSGACVGAMAYYTKGGEPPGQWAGKGAASLGLAGVVDAEVLDRLYMENISPTGEILAKRPGGKGDDRAADKAVKAHLQEHPYASVTELAEVWAKAKAKTGPKGVPYFDFTVSAVKSVSVVHASYRVAALLARQAGDTARAAELDARADAIDQAILDAARDAIAWLEEQATYTRTGYHSATTGEWRDGAGLTAALFPHHISRDGDPQLHVHCAIWNRVQRADAADGKWRTLFGRMLYQNRLGLAPVPDRFLEARLSELGFVMVPRPDGNGAEIGGVDPAVMARFSSRGVAVAGELARLAAEWEQVHGKPPSPRTLWLLHQEAGQRTRRTKAEARRTAGGQVLDHEPTEAERLAEWERQTADEELRVLSQVHRDAERFARARARARATGGAGQDAAVQPAPEDDEGPLEPLPRLVLDAETLYRTARVAVAEVQQRHAAWTMAQLRFEIHRALGPGYSAADVDRVAALVISGRSGTGVIQVGAAPDVTDVTQLGVRRSDGVSVYRPPGAERWCTTDHLDLEEWIVNTARRRMTPLVSEAQARAAVAETDLSAEQAEAVVMMLTAQVLTVPLNAAAGSGKSHTMAVFAELWTRFTGGRVIGLTTSTNAARVLAGEGLAEAYNTAEFLGKIEGSDELRRPVQVNAGDVLILDEATQASTSDIAAILQAATEAGAWLHPVGDTAQLGAVDAGGIFSLLAHELASAHLSEIRRFRNRWERDASLRLRNGDVGAIAAYDRRGRIRGADEQAAMAAAAAGYLADLLRGRDVLLLAGSNDEAADLARRVQSALVRLGRVRPGRAGLADGNYAGVGDRIRARHNSYIDAAGRRLTNRDTLLVDLILTAPGDPGGEPTGVVARRRLDDGTWSARFPLPADYLAHHAELDYAGNVHVAQGRTVDAAHLLVSQSLSRQSLYVGMTRGRQENTAHVVTGNTAPAGSKPYEQASPESVLAGVLEREAEELSATAQMRAGQDWAWGAGHVLHLWSVAVREQLYPAIDAMVTARLTPAQAARYGKEWARQAFHASLREAQLAGHDPAELVRRVLDSGPLDGAKVISSVLHSRLDGLGLDVVHDTPWSARTPDGMPQIAHDLAEGLDSRARVLGERTAARPEPWLLRHLGQLAPDASPALRAEYERRAGVCAAYREAAGIRNPEQSLAPEPHAGNPELETFRKMAMHALEIRDEAELMRGLSRGELEALTAQGDRTVAAAPADVSAELRAAGQARADAWAQAAQSQVSGDAATAAAAEAEARRLEADEALLGPQAETYDRWSEATAEVRERASRAAAELERRGTEPLPDGPDPDPWAAEEEPPEAGEDPEALAAWWAGFEADADAAEAAVGAERARAEEAGLPWPPERRAEPAAAGIDTPAGPGPAQAGIEDPPTSEAGHEPPEGDEVPSAPRAAGPASPRGAQPAPPPPSAGPEPSQSERIDALQRRAAAAAAEVEAERQRLAASAEHQSRVEREAEHDPEARPEWQAQLDDEMEPDM